MGVPREYKVPKKVIELVKRRRRCAERLRDAEVAVDEYCASIGLNCFHPLFDDAVLCADIRIYCEEDHGYHATLEAIEAVLAERRKK